ncbi:MAG: DUF1800 family protein [Sphingomonadaceae bacterium]
MSSLAIALNRFGYGARPGDPVPADPRGWLKAQLSRFMPMPAAIKTLPTRAEIATSLADYLEEIKSMKTEAKTPDAEDKQAVRAVVRKGAREQHSAQVGARVRIAVGSDTPFAERLVHFWANHFAVSAQKLTTIGLAGMLEFEAIRPHVMGRFIDMLLAVETHPAMLLYLDQAQSIGPDSLVGQRTAGRGKARGLNENLAREILELHTLGVRTGYGQADVTEFARALTGWSVAGIGRGPAARLLSRGHQPGDFVFVNAIHQPGERTIIGKRYGDDGERQARAVLTDLARHRATAMHIATKLARHFAGDTPPASLIDRLAAVFLKTDGDLPSLYAALIDAPAIWSTDFAKFKSPWDWGISAFRAVGGALPADQIVVGMMTQLGQAVWRPTSPAGYDDIAQSWAGADALVHRVEVAERMSRQTAGAVDARALAPALMPAVLSAQTAQAIARADSAAQGLALMLVSPEFLRR